MSLPRLCLLLLVILSANCSFAQQQARMHQWGDLQSRLPDLPERSFTIADSLFIIVGNCKNMGLVLFHQPVYETVPRLPVSERAAFLKVHGNILYSFNYRSYIDTPFAQHDLQQHFVQSSFNLLIRNKYPVRMTISSRTTNSPYFKNTFDVNLQFNRGQLLEIIKADLRKQLLFATNSANAIVHKAAVVDRTKMELSGLQDIVKLDQLSKFQQEYKTRQAEVQQLQSWLNSQARMQELVEERERAMQVRNHLSKPATENLPVAMPDNDIAGMINKPVEKMGSNKASFLDFLTKRTADSKAATKQAAPVENAAARLDSAKKKLEQLKQLVKKDEANLKKAQKTITDSLSTIRAELNSLSTGPGLYAFMRKHNLSRDQLTKTQRLLLSVNQVAVGRSWVDYSELTVKNISVAGVNVELNPLPYYVAFAAGKINYRFRDFIYKNNRGQLPDQSVALIRAGLGQKEKNNFILSFYNGKKSILNSTAAAAYNSAQRIIGISAEAKFTLDANNNVTAELARSSYYNNASQQPTSADLFKKIFRLKDRTNQAYSIKLNSYYPRSNTKFTGYYKNLGENFQSFTLYPIGTNQEAWMARLNQSLWKKRLSIDAAIRKNDFVSPVAAPSFNSKNVFKSLQLLLRVPRYPFVSVGYFPSSQLSLSNNNILTESQYNTVNAVVSHSYRFRQKLDMNSNIVFTKFYNNGSDTGFIYFNASSWTVSHSIFLSSLQLQSGVSITDQQQLHLLTLEQTASYQFKKSITLTAGLKWTKENYDRDLIGCTAAMSIVIKRMGMIQLHYDRTYLPSYGRILVPVDMGQLSFYREF